jgi:glycerol-3-phosphate O-acyltransferase
MIDEITQAVLSREDIARYLQGSHGESGRAARAKIEAYLEELRTRQRYSIYRALKHPLYPILRKIERIGERVEIAKAAAKAGRVVYASNHRSHIDYLVEPLVLDDNGIRRRSSPPASTCSADRSASFTATSPVRFRSAAIRRTRRI